MSTRCVRLAPFNCTANVQWHHVGDIGQHLTAPAAFRRCTFVSFQILSKERHYYVLPCSAAPRHLDQAVTRCGLLRPKSGDKCYFPAKGHQIHPDFLVLPCRENSCRGYLGLDCLVCTPSLVILRLRCHKVSHTCPYAASLFNVA